MRAPSPLRHKFVRSILLVFAAILVLFFCVFMFMFERYFAASVSALDKIENQLIAESVASRLGDYENVAERLSSNALLTDMLITLKTADAFNSDHNHNLMAESFQNAFAKIEHKKAKLWVYNIQGGYGINAVGHASDIPLDRRNHIEVSYIKDNFTNTIPISHVGSDGQPLFKVVSPIVKNQILYGFVVITIDAKLMLQEINRTAQIHNMMTHCAVIVPELDSKMNTIGYNKYYLTNDNLNHEVLPLGFTDDYALGAAPSSDIHFKSSGMAYLSGVKSANWYIYSFVPDSEVMNAFFVSYIKSGLARYLIVGLISLLVIGYIAYRLTLPLRELAQLVDDIRENKPYKKPKGKNEITDAANKLIELTELHKSIMSEIEGLTTEIHAGKLFKRLQNVNKKGIRAGLNSMLDGIEEIFDTIPAGILVVDGRHKVLYANDYIRQIMNVGKERFTTDVILSQLEINEKDKIIREIERCKTSGTLMTEDVEIMGRSIKLITKDIDSDKHDDIFLQIYFNQTDLIAKIKEQEQVATYIEHISLIKKEALTLLAKGDFANAQINLGQRPQQPFLRTIYDQQTDVIVAFADMVRNIETIINEISDTTKAFAGGQLHSFVECNTAKGKYAELVHTANNAFEVILEYFQQIPIPIRIIGTDFRVKFFNKASFNEGFRPGKNVLCYHIYNIDRPCTICPIVTNDLSFKSEPHICEKGEPAKHYMVFRNPILDDEGKLACMLEIRINETEVFNLKKAADSANKAKSAFIANMSHEIRTPMNAILGYSQLLQMNSAISAPDMGHINIIRQSGNHLLALVNDILELSKIEAGKTILSEEQFNLKALLTETSTMFTPQMNAKGLLFTMNVSDTVPDFAIGDAMKVRQILFNVISNAIKFTSVGGITVTANASKHSDSKFGITIDIEDTGAGISEKEFDKVFSAFEQTTSGAKSGVGTGLGMPISKNFAKMMGGDLTIESTNIGQGTVFRIALVLGGASELPAGHCKKNYQYITGIDRTFKILLVDNNLNSRDALAKILTKIGFDVVESADGRTIIDAALYGSVDAVISELYTSGMDGVDAVAHIRAKAKGARLPVIFLTAFALDDDRRKAFESGCDVFLTKPFMTEKVLIALEEVGEIGYEFGAEGQCPDMANMEIGTLCEKIKEQINAAVMIGDFDEVTRISNSLADENPVFAAKAAEYADNFDKNAILNLLRMSN